MCDLSFPMQAVHQFDQFTEHTSGCFHPRGLEVILNSEVWDLRTFKLLRCESGRQGLCVWDLKVRRFTIGVRVYKAGRGFVCGPAWRAASRGQEVILNSEVWDLCSSSLRHEERGFVVGPARLQAARVQGRAVCV